MANGITNLTSLTLDNALTVGGAVTVVGASVTVTGGLPSAQIATGAVKRKFFTLKPCPGGGVACSNTTTYFAVQPVPRAGIVKAIKYQTAVDPTSGTNTVKVLKNGSSGNTMLSAASVSLNGATAYTIQSGTLTSTAADLALAAGDNIYVEYAAGTQGSAAKDVTVVIEYEPTDY